MKYYPLFNYRLRVGNVHGRVFALVVATVWMGCFIVGCDIFNPPTPLTEREKQLIALLENPSITASDSLSCYSSFALNSPDRYIYKRLPQEPTQPVRFEYDVPAPMLESMSTRGLLQTGLGHPNNMEIAPLVVCSSIRRCRESMFELSNTWRAFEQRSDALDECLKRYTQFIFACNLNSDVRIRVDQLIQITLIEVILTRPKFLEQLTPVVRGKLLKMMVSKHKQKDIYFESELGKTQGLWLMCVLMLEIKDKDFQTLVAQNKEIEAISKGLIFGHTLQSKALILSHAERVSAHA
jgi:hypothetical protein